jgi:hypothetical protein
MTNTDWTIDEMKKWRFDDCFSGELNEDELARRAQDDAEREALFARERAYEDMLPRLY